MYKTVHTIIYRIIQSNFKFKTENNLILSQTKTCASNSLAVSYIIIMLTIHSPKFSASSRGEHLHNKLSPSFRNKRVPSAQDHYSTESNNIKNSKTQSPSKFSQEVLRRKSQLGENNPHVMNNPTSKKSKDKNTQNIIDSIHYLKEEYKTLKEAYKELIQQKLKNTEEIKKYKLENGALRADADRYMKENQKLKMQMSFLQQDNDRTKRQYNKLLEVQKFKAKQLEESLLQKQQYINQTLFKIRTEGDESDRLFKNTLAPQSYRESNKNEEESLTISQDKSILPDKERSLTNQSQFLSFSLTSVLEQSTYQEPSVNKRKKEHTKVVSELTHRNQEEIKVNQAKSTKNKDVNYNFKKFRKEMVPKLDLNNEIRESKHNLVLNNLGNLLNPKTPLGLEKKGSRSKATKSFRRKEEEKDCSNTQLKNAKKKSKKLINLSSNQ